MPGPQAVSDAHGPLRHVLFCFPEEAARRSAYRAAFTGLFGLLPASTRLTVLTQAGAVDDLAEVLAASGVGDRTTVLLAPAGMEFTVWAQDPFVVVGDESGPRLVQPASFEPEGDNAVATIVATGSGMVAERSHLRFHGGHVLVGDDFALVSRDCLVETESLDPDPEATAAEFGALLGDRRRVVFVGTDLPVPRRRSGPCPTAASKSCTAPSGARLPSCTSTCSSRSRAGARRASTGCWSAPPRRPTPSSTARPSTTLSRPSSTTSPSSCATRAST
jgi:hypothetical protein